MDIGTQVLWRNYWNMQSKSKTVNQAETEPYSAANSTVCSEPWWNNTAYNSFCPRAMRGSVSDSSSAEQSGDVQSQSEGDDTVKDSPNSTPLQPGMARLASYLSKHTILYLGN